MAGAERCVTVDLASLHMSLGLILVAWSVWSDANPPSPWFGLELLQGPGCIEIAEVQPDSPSEKGGLRVGDCVIAIGGQAVRKEDELIRLLHGLNQGTPVTFNLKDGRKLTVSPRPSTEDDSRRFCEYLASRRSLVYLSGWTPAGTYRQERLRMKGSTTVGAIRKRFGFIGAAEATLRACNQREQKRFEDVPDSFEVRNASVRFLKSTKAPDSAETIEPKALMLEAP